MDRVFHNRLSLIFILLILVFLTQIFSLMSSGNQIDKINYIKKEIAKSKSVVDSLYKKNKGLDKKIDQLNSKIDGLDNSISANNDKIDKLKKNEKSQIDNFKHYDSGMWEKYFTDRYSKK
jgi:septal ring factor EnvC (AmiA/AmiB activator)